MIFTTSTICIAIEILLTGGVKSFAVDVTTLQPWSIVERAFTKSCLFSLSPFPALSCPALWF